MKYYKNIQANMVYLGFPDTALNSILEQCEKKGFRVNRNKELIEIDGFGVIKGFDNWKNQYEENQLTVAEQNIGYNKSIQPVITVSKKNIEKMILNFPIASKSPMECQQFLYEIQNRLNGTLQ